MWIPYSQPVSSPVFSHARPFNIVSCGHPKLGYGLLRQRVCGIVLTLLLITVSYSGLAHADNQENEPDTVIQAGAQQPSDAEIAERIREIFREIPSLHDVEVEAQAGVVRLSGTTADAQAAQRAAAVAKRVSGVVTIENLIQRDVSLNNQLNPALQTSKAIATDIVAMLPLLTLALAVFLVVILIGVFLARRDRLWARITPNAFIAELVATTVRAVFVILALVLAFNLLGATALLSAVLGSAGVIGLAVGFAVRDTIENYIASIMLSLRQPFRPKDHILINNNEGRVIRLTSRATILMTLDGNHLRIPNSEVFKSTILNYTTNPERRFDFELGVDANDDPLHAIQIGQNAMASLDFVLNDPPPSGVIKQVGDSNIVIRYSAWINQHRADFGKSRSLALVKVKNALEKMGFGLPEPIYRLRFDPDASTRLRVMENNQASALERSDTTSTSSPVQTSASMDVSPDRHIDQKVEAERRDTNQTDLLNETVPTE